MKKIKGDQLKSDYQTAPKINKNSVKIFEEKQQKKNDQVNMKVHDRLYNKRNENVKSSTLFKSYNTEGSCKNLNPTKQTEERINILYQDALKRQNKQKEIQNRKSEEKIHKSNYISNKYVLKKFEKRFKENVEEIIKITLQGHKDNQITDQPINKINIEQLVYLMQKMNFLSNEEIQNSLTNNNCENPLSYKNIEKKLIFELFDSLKDKDKLINLDHLFIFSLSILNLLEYYIVKGYLENNPNENNDNNDNEPVEINSLSNKNSERNLNIKNNNSHLKLIKKTSSVASLYESDSQNLENLLVKLNFELKSRIVSNKKFGGLDPDGNFIITFTHSKLIFKEFNLLALNYNTLNSNTKKSEKIPQVEGEIGFKPKINNKSKELGNKYRQKILDQFELMNIKGK